MGDGRNSDMQKKSKREMDEGGEDEGRRVIRNSKSISPDILL